MRILPEDKRERKWFIGIVIILILWWPFVLFYDIDFLFLWDQPSPIPYIIFSIFVGLISKMKMKRCFYVSLKGAFVPVILLLFYEIIIISKYNVKLKGIYIWGLSEGGYILGIIVFLTIMNSLIFSVCSLFDAALREKFFTRS